MFKKIIYILHRFIIKLYNNENDEMKINILEKRNLFLHILIKNKYSY